MTTSASTTFSPSRRRPTRSTPCVLWCCGTMLITSSLVSNIAPWTVVGVSSALPVLLNVRLFACLAQLQPVFGVFHQQFAGALQRIVLALREPLPVVGHQDPAPIGMAGEIDAEHVVDLALEPVGGRPDAGDGGHGGVLAGADLDPHTMAVARRVEAVDEIEPPLFARRPVDGGDVGAEVERRVRRIAQVVQRRGHLRQRY